MVALPSAVDVTRVIAGACASAQDATASTISRQRFFIRLVDDCASAECYAVLTSVPAMSSMKFTMAA